MDAPLPKVIGAEKGRARAEERLPELDAIVDTNFGIPKYA